MTIHYMDASVWVKRYIREEGSQRTNAWMNENPLVASSALGVIEVLSTVVRKARAGEISNRARDAATREAAAEFDLFAQLFLTNRMLSQVREAALHYGLRGADTVHLASALWLQEHPPEDVTELTFLTSDRELAEAAEAAGLDVFDPTRDALPAP